MPHSLIIADSHKIARESLRKLLDQDSYFEILDEAKTGKEALQMVKQWNPEIIILDIIMPDINGVKMVKQMVKACSQLKIIALSLHLDQRIAKKIISAGASAYLLKEYVFEELNQAIKSAMENRIYLSSKLNNTIINK